MPKTPTEEVLARFKAIVGPKGFVEAPEDQTPYLKEWRDRFSGKTPLVLRPSSTEVVSAIMKVADETGTAIVPQGGNTGLVGGQIPNSDGTEVILSLDRMSCFRDIDAQNNTMTVDAGCVLATIQQAAESAERLFPLSLASEGSAQIGGLMSTNAGGINVLRYGNARDLALGLEVVLPNGDVWNGLKGLRKDNTGYDLKHLFIGAEGTLGIITGVTLKLFPQLSDHATALIGVTDLDAAVDLFSTMKHALGDVISAFELMPRIAIEYLLKHDLESRDPLNAQYPWYLLVELDDVGPHGRLDTALEENLARCVSKGLAQDAVVAKNDRESQSLWQMRERLSAIQKHEGGSLKHDVSVPISQLTAFVNEATLAVEHVCPGIRPFPFGHLGDGNIHFNFSQPPDLEIETFLARADEIARIVHDCVAKYGGSFSAEHGIGQLKRDDLTRYKSATEIDMMRRLKQTFDPKGIINPGKVL